VVDDDSDEDDVFQDFVWEDMNKWHCWNEY
jgi:hypothetical protein